MDINKKNTDENEKKKDIREILTELANGFKKLPTPVKGIILFYLILFTIAFIWMISSIIVDQPIEAAIFILLIAGAVYLIKKGKSNHKGNLESIKNNFTEINCPYCDGRVTVKDKTCPHCGGAITLKNNKEYLEAVKSENERYENTNIAKNVLTTYYKVTRLMITFAFFVMLLIVIFVISINNNQEWAVRILETIMNI